MKKVEKTHLAGNRLAPYSSEWRRRPTDTFGAEEPPATFSQKKESRRTTRKKKGDRIQPELPCVSQYCFRLSTLNRRFPSRTIGRSQNRSSKNQRNPQGSKRGGGRGKHKRSRPKRRKPAPSSFFKRNGHPHHCNPYAPEGGAIG